MYAFAMLIDQIINIYVWTLLAYLATGWLIAFKIINPWQPVVRMIIDALSRVHEPLLRPVRRMLPDFGALDVSPIVLWHPVNQQDLHSGQKYAGKQFIGCTC